MSNVVCKTRTDVVRIEIDLSVLRQTSIIGITTTGLARNIDLLIGMKLKVLICEGASEVMEAMFSAFAGYAPDHSFGQRS